MTLIIAGHHYRQGIRWTKNDESPAPLSLEGLFFASDSIITSENRAPLLGGFRKVYSVKAQLWKPYFVGQYFRSYREVFSEAECVVAFAGSTLTAQHVLNSITTHLGQLRVSYQRADDWGVPGKYIVELHCKESVLSQAVGVSLWDDDMFLPRDMQDLLTADVISDAVEYSINEALRSARRYKLDQAAFATLYTEFAFGLKCPVSKTYRLFCYRIQRREVDGILEVFTAKEEIQAGKLAVLGRSDDFAEEAQQRFEAAIDAREEPSKAMFEYLNEAIDRSHASGRKDIDRPSSLKVFDELDGLEVTEYRPAD